MSDLRELLTHATQPTGPSRLCGQAARARARERQRRHHVGLALAGVAAFAVALSGLAVGVLAQPGSERLSGPVAGSEPRTAVDAAPKPAWTETFSARLINSDGFSLQNRPAEPEGQVTQVAPTVATSRYGILRNTNGDLCYAQVVGPGDTQVGCPQELKSGWSGIWVTGTRTTRTDQDPVDVINGFVPTSVNRLTADAGTGPEAITLYRGPSDAAHLNFFAYTGSLMQGPVTFHAYSANGTLLFERRNGGAGQTPGR